MLIHHFPQARDAWVRNGVAITGVVAGAAQAMPLSSKGQGVFGPNDGVRHALYNLALQTPIQQHYLSSSIRYESPFRLELNQAHR